jgi:2-keto-4-pentenoate hydratase/2-oxohepta-3-ene-1,7-dioic acid hydratase in catechol pathway
VRLITYADDRGLRLGALKDGGFVDLQDAAHETGTDMPCDMRGLIDMGEPGLDAAERLLRSSPPRPLPAGSLRPPIPDLRKNVVAVGRNYHEHLEEGARARGVDAVVPDHAVFFTKPPTALIGHEMDIEFDPRATKQLDYEAELVVVIGRRGRNIRRDDALDHVFGYTVGNDISARDLQRAHLQWFKGKGMDTFCPIGPCIVPARDIADPQDLGICSRVNGETRQSARTSMMIYDIPAIIEQLSIGLTLEPGDLIMTGTPGGVGLGMDPQRWLADGDVIEAEIDGIGILRNRVVRVGDADD